MPANPGWCLHVEKIFIVALKRKKKILSHHKSQGADTRQGWSEIWPKKGRRWWVARRGLEEGWRERGVWGEASTVGKSLYERRFSSYEHFYVLIIRGRYSQSATFRAIACVTSYSPSNPYEMLTNWCLCFSLPSNSASKHSI